MFLSHFNPLSINSSDINVAFFAFDIFSIGIDLNHLGVELSEEVKVLLQVGGQNGLDDQEAETFEFHMVQVDEEVVLRVGHEEIPGRGSVVVFQNGSVIVEHCLQTTRGPNTHIYMNKDKSPIFTLKVRADNVTGYIIWL